jgi:hypothetical protein
MVLWYFILFNVLFDELLRFHRTVVHIPLRFKPAGESCLGLFDKEIKDVGTQGVTSFFNQISLNSIPDILLKVMDEVETLVFHLVQQRGVKVRKEILEFPNEFVNIRRDI